MPHFWRWSTLVLVLSAAACSSDPGNGTGPVDLSSCTAANTLPIALDIGQFQTIDALQQSNCIALPGSGVSQEYVVVAYSGYGFSTNQGTSASDALQSVVTTPAPAASIAPLLPASPVESNAARFDRTLRLAERQLAMNPAAVRGALRQPPSAPPVVGDKDSFYVCASASCSSFNRIGATVKYAGAPGVIYVDDQHDVGADVFTGGDIQQFGALFDNYLYATDTTAFGRESDINGDQHIAILMTPAVNSLTSDCSDGRIIGYTFSSDLIPSARSSNAREMFYTIVPSLATSKCKAISRSAALVALPSTLIHELQHMISFNQHVLLRFGFDQDLWMNEGLSHFAEELGWRTVPASQCTSAPGGNCFSEFVGGNISNAFDYLNGPESQYLIAPEAGDGTLGERGASWLFLRWASDHFSADTLLGTQFTRALSQSGVLGAARVAQVTGVSFPALVGEWQMSNWTDNLPGFPQTGLLNYRTWNLRAVFAANYPAVFNKIYPLTPDSTTGSYSHPGSLLAGSGKTVRYKLPAGSPSVTIRLAGNSSGGALSTVIVPWLAVVRVK
jgi:hypothetical protein